ncbi:Hpt domain-containing protein [Sabulicella rubraurantiaca]|uniref:Hpt domain-containing protein n=1 Tax=Sabulicella rubraurantiaca TaxID=2811429 RepID=UPI001A96B6A6|nr:Hpt domain-containing protein [Sabulicella rubraurantiaca]
MPTGKPDFGEALLAAWPRPAAVLDPSGRLLAWNREFSRLAEPETLWRGRSFSGREFLSRSLENGCTLIEWDPEEAAMSEARRLCQEEVSAKLDSLGTLFTLGDLQAMRAESHALRGLAANFGMVTLLPALQALEEACRAGDENGAAEAMVLLRKEVGPALQALAAQLG